MRSSRPDATGEIPAHARTAQAGPDALTRQSRNFRTSWTGAAGTPQAEKEVATAARADRQVSAPTAEIKTNKEYQAMSAEIERLQGRIDEWDTGGLEKLEIEDDCQRELDRMQVEMQKQQAENEAKAGASASDARQEKLIEASRRSRKTVRATPDPWRDDTRSYRNASPAARAWPSRANNAAAATGTLSCKRAKPPRPARHRRAANTAAGSCTVPSKSRNRHRAPVPQRSIVPLPPLRRPRRPFRCCLRQRFYFAFASPCAARHAVSAVGSIRPARRAAACSNAD